MLVFNRASFRGRWWPLELHEIFPANHWALPWSLHISISSGSIRGSQKLFRMQIFHGEMRTISTNDSKIATEPIQNSLCCLNCPHASFTCRDEWKCLGSLGNAFLGVTFKHSSPTIWSIANQSGAIVSGSAQYEANRSDNSKSNIELSHHEQFLYHWTCFFVQKWDTQAYVEESWDVTNLKIQSLPSLDASALSPINLYCIIMAAEKKTCQWTFLARGCPLEPLVMR